MSQYDHVFRLLLLGDHTVGKTAVIKSFRSENLGNFRGRRNSVPLRPFVTVDIEMYRRNKHLMIKAVDTGGMYTNSYT
jgi:GTPase SAR1 family protein